MAIDRMALVRRHNPVLHNPDPMSPLSVGNGNFCFTSDVTGTQTLSRVYADACPLTTMAGWGWHRFPESYNPDEYERVMLSNGSREVPYLLENPTQPELYRKIRENKHKFHIGQISLTDGGQPLDRVRDIRQELDLWTGILYSRFTYRDQPVSVKTCVHPDADAVAIEVETELDLDVTLDFPYASSGMSGADWEKDDCHVSELTGDRIARRMDECLYFADAPGARRAGAHRFTLPKRAVVRFSARECSAPVPDALDTFAASALARAAFWQSGAAIELNQNDDPRAFELERRVVLSQYLLSIQCAGDMPPQETGLTVNSWYGKCHLEMHWWHGAHYAYWGRLPLFERSLGFYRTILPEAEKTARAQGYQGARWPKMTDDTGADSPSPIGPALCWQQPHPIYYACQAKACRPGSGTLRMYADIVYETAKFMADYAILGEDGRYHLGPPMIPAQECWDVRVTRDPTFELTYWRFGLREAINWKKESGEAVPEKWARVYENLALPSVTDGVYPAVASDETTYTTHAVDHPAMLCALGMIDGEGIDKQTMLRTLDKVLSVWNFDSAWGWDFPVMAMCATRAGAGERAVDLLLTDAPKNRYLTNGHNYQRPDLPLYLPGNGGLLAAVAMMAAGFRENGGARAPGFPKEWTVRAEGFMPAL